MKLLLIFFFKPILRFIGTIIAISVIAMLIVGAISNQQDALTGYGKASERVTFYSGVAFWNLPHLMNTFMGSKVFVDNSANGQSTVPSSLTKSATPATTWTAQDQQSAELRASKACAGSGTAKKIAKCEKDFIAVAKQADALPR